MSVGAHAAPRWTASRWRPVRRRPGTGLLALACACRPGSACGPVFIPPAPGLHATDHNGIELPPACYNQTTKDGWFHVFVIGDWGGRIKPAGVTPADNTKKGTNRPFVSGVDDSAQLKVADQMRKRAKDSNPDYLLNVGDSFYWGGIEVKCGSPPFQHVGAAQWSQVFEAVYTGPGLDGKPWLGVLGNHDYGGFLFTNGWDQEIGYTWSAPSRRWMMPAQYWRVKVIYGSAGFSVDYYFVDTNVFNAWESNANEDHNICSKSHNVDGASCGPEGPENVGHCTSWFSDLWEREQDWMERQLARSDATWQILVTHYPPDIGTDIWTDLAWAHGIDLFVSGHRHCQEVHKSTEPWNPVRPSTYIVTGGGGGITSEGVPSVIGDDDMYGFMDLSLSANRIKVEVISHSGKLRHELFVLPRPRGKPTRPPVPTTTGPATSTSTLSSTSTIAATQSTTVTQTATSSSTTTSTVTAVVTTSVVVTAGTTAANSSDHSGHDYYTLKYKPCNHFPLLEEVTDRHGCETAARKLQLSVTDPLQMGDPGRIKGCFFTTLEGESDLWLSSRDLNKVSAMGLTWQHVCVRRSKGRELDFFA